MQIKTTCLLVQTQIFCFHFLILGLQSVCFVNFLVFKHEFIFANTKSAVFLLSKVSWQCNTYNHL